jgi:hypothetical protein
MGLDAATLGKLSIANSLAFSAPGASTILVSAPVTIPAPDLSLSARTITAGESLAVTGDLTLRADVALNIAAGKTVSSGGGNIEVANRAGTTTFGASGILNSTNIAQLATTGFLVLGDALTTSSVSIAQPLNASAFGGLLLRASGNITQTAGSVITAPKLSAQSSFGSVTLPQDNAISGALSGSTGSSGTFNFTNAAPLTVGTVDGVAGINVGSGNVTLRADGLDLQQPITAFNVTLAPRVAGTAINLGTDSGFGLTDAEIDLVAANTLNIGVSSGNANGPITVAGAVDRAFGNLNLVTAPGSSIAVNAALGSASTGSVSMNAGAGGSVNIAAPVSASGNVTANADSIATSQQIKSRYTFYQQVGRIGYGHCWSH